MPPAILAKLVDGLQRAMADEEVRRLLLALGTVPAFEGPKAFADFIARDVERNVALLRAVNFQPE